MKQHVMNLRAADDWALVNRKGQEQQAYEILFERHKDYVYRVARYLASDDTLARDATQEVFTRLYLKRARWTPRAALRTLLYRITVNVVRELLRKRPPMVHLDAGHLQLPAPVPDPGGPPARGQVDGLLRKLPPRQRETVVLRFYERLSVRETARVLGCREGTVKAHLHKAMIAMRRELDRRPLDKEA